ncbi:hypothetical protein, unknown function [Leishmania mexicana MHOM/GT/2001/U1103]|uniref:Uncharacterized protein n=1 Tax=Leishmania mexicana (strain MHOM/GT/2001/U1103) TaxID=929439 RepID=E9B306_LEIMU|nr:hypothetical protein, unknown function [Leishmania mexicana MHOM/GT/2001/U1103]CBZ29620.1 hypothetical protein, unknown function [Leishmania mexicana MHOM/GT/2001/U1103]
MMSDECENASCTTHITLLHELDTALQMTSTSEISENASSSNASSVSAGSTAIPECASTRCNTPDVTATAAALPLFSRVLSLHPYGANVPPLYKLSAEDAALRAHIAVNAKLLLHTLTGYEADDIIDLLYVNETWFSAEVLIYALCLVNRLTSRYPSWRAPHAEADRDDASAVDSPVRCSYTSGVQTSPPTLTHVCSSTSSDASHIDNDDITMNDRVSELKERIHSSSTNSLGDVFNRHNTRRRIVALLLIAGKFHGDVVYNTSSLANALNKFRDEKRSLQEHCATVAPTASTATTSAKLMPSRPPPRIAPAHLGQCEKWLFQELGCTVFVHRKEYQHCEDIVFRGI